MEKTIKNTHISSLEHINNDKYFMNMLIDKIKERYVNEDEQFFVTNFYEYLNYKKDEFVIKLDSIWEWLGYSRIDKCRNLLFTKFEKDKDFIIEDFNFTSSNQEVKSSPLDKEKNFKPASSYQEAVFSNKEITKKNLGGSGLNKLHIKLTIDCFKELCLQANIEKAKNQIIIIFELIY